MKYGYTTFFMFCVIYMTSLSKKIKDASDVHFVTLFVSSVMCKDNGRLRLAHVAANLKKIEKKPNVESSVSSF